MTHCAFHWNVFGREMQTWRNFFLIVLYLVCCLVLLQKNDKNNKIECFPGENRMSNKYIIQFTFCQLFIQQMCDFSTYIVIVSSIVFYFFIIIFFKRKESSHINDRMLSSFYGVENAAIMKDIGSYISKINIQKSVFMRKFLWNIP